MEETTMKKLIAILLCCAMALALAGCAGTTVVVGNCTCPPESHNDVTASTEAPVDAPLGTALKTGLAILPEVSGKNAAAEENGVVTYDVTVVAVLVDDKGVIHDCVIDSLGATAEFDASGLPVAGGTAEVKTKNELGFDYGMVAYNASGIGKEWFEQAAALADYAVGKTVAEVAGGYSSDVDLATKATIYLGGYVSGIEAAVANAQALGAEAGHELKLAVNTTLDAADGKIQLNLDAAALTLDGETITSCTIDSLQAVVEFDATGTITSDLSAPKTKNQLGYDYGMVAYNASAIGKEWFEQVENFCTYVTGKTLAQVNGITVDAGTKPTDVDLATQCSIAIGGFQKLISKAVG